MKEKLFQTFGEFDSFAEINEAAEGLLMEGDLEGLRKLAAENGLEEEAEQYIKKETDELCGPIEAAIGKIRVECEEENSVFYEDVMDYLMANCDDLDFALAVRKKGKRVSEAADRVAKEAFRNTTMINGMRCNYCGPMRGYQLIREYYLKEERL